MIATYSMAITNFFLYDIYKKDIKNFLVANTYIEVVLRIFIFLLSRANMRFICKKLK